ncbi:Cyclic nucleotide-binding domain [Dillenia turbinata]|uniref:Cyclic nucleotide-binding domain n=1 Tax=Dillenia turbinata TaxID=194707 RepID=A0AAN8UAW3_9MAGN
MHNLHFYQSARFRQHLRRHSLMPSRAKPKWTYKILDPGSQFVTRWNHIFMISCLIALFLDPLYFYLPMIDSTEQCITTDTGLLVAVTIFRTIADLFYLMHIIIKFKTAFIEPSSRVFGRGELVMDQRQIAMRYLKSDFVIDVAAVLPLPQVVNWLIAAKVGRTDHANHTLSLIVLIQYVPRLFVIFPLNNRIIKTTGVVAKTAWTGAAYNLLLYMLASHVSLSFLASSHVIHNISVLGASWYVLSAQRENSCWREEVMRELNGTSDPTIFLYLDCDTITSPERQQWKNGTLVFNNCDARNDNFKFGIFAEAFINEIASSSFTRKYYYCLWWGLKSLSSYGQGLANSNEVSETLFCIVICIAGLVLFAQLIGNMQTYLQSMTVRLEEWRVKRRDTEEWMRHRQLPLDLQERVRRFVQYKWLATRGVDEEAILRSLPLDLRREIQRHLCLQLVRRVPFFSQMDDQLLDAICERLVSSLSTRDTYIVREGDPVTEMLFIIRGQLESSTTNGGRSGFFNSITLGPGDFCGEELLTWALMPSSSLNLPSSTRTVRSLTEVEAFALRAEDLRFVAGQFKRLHSKKLQHAFRYYSHQWRTWGSCIIQAAWRRFKKHKMMQELAMQESLYYRQMSDRGSSSSEDQALLGNYEAEGSSAYTTPHLL